MEAAAKEDVGAVVVVEMEEATCIVVDLEVVVGVAVVAAVVEVARRRRWYRSWTLAWR